jgi:hypothetical protein
MWIEHVLNPKALTSIYPTQAPSLAQVRLHELAILCGNDLQCRLQFDLRDFPVGAPAKWVQRQCNTVQLTLRLIQATIDHCVIPSGSGVGDLSITYEAPSFQVEFRTQLQGVVFRATATWIHVDSIVGYLAEQPT